MRDRRRRAEERSSHRRPLYQLPALPERASRQPTLLRLAKQQRALYPLAPYQLVLLFLPLQATALDRLSSPCLKSLFLAPRHLTSHHLALRCLLCRAFHRRARHHRAPYWLSGFHHHVHRCPASHQQERHRPTPQRPACLYRAVTRLRARPRQ